MDKATQAAAAASIPDVTDEMACDGKLQIDELSLTVCHTPGHTPGGVCIVCYGLLFSGDTLFAGSCGRTDFRRQYAGDESLSPFMELLPPDATKVLPGHGEFSTLGQERRSNPYNNAHGG